MLPPEVLRQIRRLQLRARRAVTSLLGGEYHSVFKGTGLSFEEVREYQPGDDVRGIDWNVTARMGSPFIKRFVEERELTVLLVVDVSASLQFGTQQSTKRNVLAELAALIAFSAVANNDRVGLIVASDTVERYVPPSKGTRHVLRMLRDILFFEPQGKGTSLKTTLDFLNQVQTRRCIVFLMSDFLDQNYEGAFRLSAQKHDLIAVRVQDLRETTWPDMGLVWVEDAETGEQRLIDTHSSTWRELFAKRMQERQAYFLSLIHANQVDRIEVSTEGTHFDALVQFFRLRERRQRRNR